MKLSLEELYELSKDRPLSTPEINPPNDYYGHAHILKQYVNLPPTYQIKASIEHGVGIFDNVWDNDVKIKLPAIFYPSSSRHPVFKKRTNKALFAIGPIISYAHSFLDSEAFEREKKRIGRNLLAFPAHSTHWIYAQYDIHEYCNLLEELSKGFDTVRVCLGWNDILRGQAEEFMKHGFECVTAGHMYDPLFLPRFRSIIELATVTTSNLRGTHVGYCILLGKSHYLSHKHIDVSCEKEEMIAISDYRADSPEFQKILRACGEFREDVTPEQNEIAEKYWGAGEVKTVKEMRIILQLAEDMYAKGPRFYMSNHKVQLKQSLDYLNLNRNEEALVSLDQSIDVYPEYSGLNYGKAVALARLGNISEAIKTLDNLLTVLPDHKKAHLLLSELNPISVSDMVEQAAEALQANKTDVAFILLNEAKSLRQTIQGLDFLRALCFLKMNRPHDAREALREELRYFPQNHDAKNLLSQILEQHPQMISGRIGDQEFQELLQIIRPYTMLSEERLFSLFSLAKRVCLENIPGNFVECGVAAGGSSALLASVIKRYSKQPRRLLYAFDSFEGMPTPSEHDKHNGLLADATGWGTGTCAAPEESLREICAKIGVSEIIQTVKGYFQDTLPGMQDKIGMISLLHMDGDWYESTKTILDNLYDMVVNDGLIQVDDYGFWEGCRKAIHEFEVKRDIKFQINNIDNTGIWFSKSDNFRLAPTINEDSDNNVVNIKEKQAYASNEKPKKANLNSTLVNLGCGNRYHLDWINVDFHSTGEGVIAHNLTEGIPFEDNSFDVAYHSHLLEHFPKSHAPVFLKECFRVIKDSGIIRVVVPDLEQIAKYYLSLLEKSLRGDKDARKQYEWIMLELFDQMVRNVSGGEMLEYWKQEPMPAESFVIERMGSEVLNILTSIRNNKNKYIENPKEQSFLNPEKIGNFRLSGEIHQWMYDRYSLGALLRQVGFKDAKVCLADESQIPNFDSYLLDIESDGSVRKPDSLFMEGRK